jgi:hypothetical protein
MNKLPFAHAAELVAVFNAGAKFVFLEKLSTGDRRREVTTITANPNGTVHATLKGGGMVDFEPSGVHQNEFFKNWFLEMVAAPSNPVEVFPLPYKTNGELIAAFNAGVKFAVKLDGAVLSKVVSIVADAGTLHGIRVRRDGGSENGFSRFKMDGTNTGDLGHTLVRIIDSAHAPQNALDLPFKHFDEMVEAFNAGTKFAVRHGDEVGAVTAMSRTGAALTVRAVGFGVWCEFNLDGTHDYWSKQQGVNHTRLVLAGPVIRKDTQAKLQEKLANVTSNSVVPEPFLKRVLDGVNFYVPATREVLHSIQYAKGRLETYLRDEKGVLRLSTNYKHDGTHKWVAARSLVAGALPPLPPAPPKKRKVNVTIYKHAYNGTLFVIREGEVIPNIRGISNATAVGTSTIEE